MSHQVFVYRTLFCGLWLNVFDKSFKKKASELWDNMSDAERDKIISNHKSN